MSDCANGYSGRHLLKLTKFGNTLQLGLALLGKPNVAFESLHLSGRNGNLVSDYFWVANAARFARAQDL